MIKFSHIMKKYDNLTPLKDIDGEIKTGEIVSIIGSSGTGKSTLLRMINGLEKPSSGKIFVDDIEVNDKTKTLITKKVGMVFQSFNLFSHLSVIENLMIAQVEIFKRDKQTAYDKSIELLKEVGLEDKEDSMPSELSGGEKQRVALARALALDPEVILLDEPTSALDPNKVSVIETLILKLAKSGKTIVMVTHSMKLAKNVSNKVFYLDEGIIYEEGTPEEIFETPKKPKTQQFIYNQNFIEFRIDQNFDYTSSIAKLIEFCAKHNISVKQANKVMLVFEEVRQMLIDKYQTPYIVLCINYNKGDINISVKYKGEMFDIKDSKDDISLKLVEGLAKRISYSYNEDDEYENVVGIEL